MDENEILPLREVAEMLDLTERRVQQLCKQQLLGTRVDGRYRITRGEVEHFKRTHVPAKPGRKRIRR